MSGKTENNIRKSGHWQAKRQANAPVLFLKNAEI